MYARRNESKKEVTGQLASPYMDFMLSRQAMQCTQATMDFYKYTAGRFLQWVGDKTPKDINALTVRKYLVMLSDQGKADTTLHDHARAIKTLLRFWNDEGYMEPVKFEMPRLSKKRLPILSVEQLKKAMDTCKNKRDKAILLFLVDSGLRRGGLCNLNVGDVDMQTGLVRVKQGKGNKDRSAVVSPTVRRALLAYRRKLKNNPTPLFTTRTGERITGNAIALIFRKLSKATGAHITSHALRRTFVILSLRSGIDALHLQNLVVLK